MDFANKIVLLTGASSGLGAACALKFAKLSARLSLVGRNSTNLQKVAGQCLLASGHKPQLITADITDDNDVERIINDVVDHYGGIDVLINNAGMMLVNTKHNMDAYDRILATNLRGVYSLTSKAIEHLVKAKGNIVNISSILSSTPNPAFTPYCMSKAALDMFTKCLAAELGIQGVRVNSVNPGPIKTEIFRRAGFSEEEVTGFLETLKQASPLKRLVDANGVADLVLYLASDKANCITGSCYVIDSGLSIFVGNQNE